MLERLRYVTGRRNRNGRVRWYWQRRGHELTRLPDNPIERMAATQRLNNVADAIPLSAELPRDSIGGLIQRYRDSDGYQALAAGTVKYYKRYLRDIEALGPGLPFASFTRQAVVDFIKTGKKPVSIDTGEQLVTDHPVPGVPSIDTAEGAKLCWG